MNNVKHKKRAKATTAKNIKTITLDLKKIKNEDESFRIEIDKPLNELIKIHADIIKTKENLEKQIRNCNNNFTNGCKYGYKEVFDFQHGDDWHNLCDIFSGMRQMGITGKAYSDFEYYYHEVHYKITECENLQNMIEYLKIKSDFSNFQQELNKKSESILQKLEGIIPTLMGIIFSVSIITTLITAIGKINVYYLPLFLFSTIWVGMTLMIFVSRYFHYEDKLVKENRHLYYIISFFTLLILIYSIFIPKIYADKIDDNFVISENNNEREN